MAAYLHGIGRRDLGSCSEEAETLPHLLFGCRPRRWQREVLYKGLPRNQCWRVLRGQRYPEACILAGPRVIKASGPLGDKGKSLGRHVSVGRRPYVLPPGREAVAPRTPIGPPKPLCR
ncbi:hypothetical protein BGW36DRAFT_383528 [Talaromyces proteolyticus]|uniref:Uncharacterized protein n=1 Tax=Talaromyces proteolyticus TaxID=1131652 RepID=A0AAD4KJ35_9EURO|nr:uncharacterized protein BGW36DRAFT_383528 [Talaromyces proteolyticus]KAH8693690.1 hypothetical protein BGW36DRAFT_383528 [Talaromyces proteolyticus]